MACTEIISFPYTRSGRGPSGPKIGLNHPQIAGIRKTVPFRTPAGRLAVALSMSALRPGADVHVDSAACPQMTLSRPSGDEVYRHEVYGKPGIAV